MSTDAKFAADIAQGAGELLLEIRDAGMGTVDGRELGRRGDGAAHAFLAGRLAAERGDDAVLSEESADDSARLSADRVWIIDPLDGSKEYGLAGRTDWAVHVALWERDRGITAAAVAQPALGVVYDTENGDHDRDRLGAGAAHPRIVVSDSRPPAFTDAVATDVGAEVVGMGSAGAKAMAVLRGEADAYVHAGGQWEWDSAAPVGVAKAAGLHCSRIDGTPLLYNESHPYLPDLVICRPELAEALLGALARHALDTPDTGRVALARAYIDALVSHDASKVRFAEGAWRVENGQRTGDSGRFIRDELENGAQYEAIHGVREARFHEWGENVVARYLLDVGATPAESTAIHVTEYFAIPRAEIASIVAIIEPHR
ncbi:3'(2'),5'-bisphosphate nucleotidase CysQ [Rhodococcus triatomae]|uniref:3'(2'), 5'-bisphosphate nucleotidase n=1 Tax=Rhodococcus triatomae TaxID=300028 RepID=A0A1G8LWA5_9NOCA|nr:3'(2'),5'-bisphosphate nucleotidase CysQ [Rhodococcus triatomae]QNG18255.1 3'(2'),5'-bisphosphate nucleotidase CysQ [Rhodococcus triatomae]QNG22074.1 3'(2'),5'-bisphosphate nucleotidase CysQ [Rhodococcus triatomae]SDI59994.1 3'(2'), 5'-bisphosphate nucleotidase [Rhodococcus triatomae]